MGRDSDCKGSGKAWESGMQESARKQRGVEDRGTGAVREERDCSCVGQSVATTSAA